MRTYCFKSLLAMMPILLSFSLSAQKQNIEIKALYSDSLSSAFEIIVRDSVGLHYHAEHTEHLFVKTGEASMQINDSTFTITQGEYYTIPTGAQHAVWVQSKTPLKVISVQCPQFLGKDRHFIENE